MQEHPSSAAEFRLSITKALSDQLSGAIAGLAPAPLDSAELRKLETEPGVYQLYRGGNLVYIGKAERPLPERLNHHLRKISGRQNISLSEMSFTCLYVAEDLSAMAPETLMIKQHKGDGTVLWNTNGFGGRDPGRERDTTVVKAGHFDASFPIDLGVELNLPPGQQTLGQFLKLLKDALPYTFRYDRRLTGKGEIAASRVALTGNRLTADHAFRLTMMSLPPGWQLTALPGRAILYKEAKADRYASALAWWRSEPRDLVSKTDGPRLIDQSGEVTQLDLDDEALEAEG